jgi:hypothetical protein
MRIAIYFKKDVQKNLAVKIDKQQYTSLRDGGAIRVGGRTKPLPSRIILRVMHAPRDLWNFPRR